MRRLLPTLMLLPLLAGCNAVDRLSRIGEQPELTRITNPLGEPGYRPVTTPQPEPILAERMPNSLWRPGSRAFFKDLRAKRVGDIVTVVINLNEQAQFQNATNRGRSTTENDDIANLAGFQSKFKVFLPKAISTSLPNILDISGRTVQDGSASINRQEQVSLRVAAIIQQVLPNGNMVLNGRQEMRVNYEVRDLQLAGIIRPEDISQTNTVQYDRIAEARISYGGRGQLTDVQQPRYGSQLLDIFYPF